VCCPLALVKVNNDVIFTSWDEAVVLTYCLDLTWPLT
jgi:hypothetical protein